MSEQEPNENAAREYRDWVRLNAASELAEAVKELETFIKGEWEECTDHYDVRVVMDTLARLVYRLHTGRRVE